MIGELLANLWHWRRRALVSIVVLSACATLAEGVLLGLMFLLLKRLGMPTASAVPAWILDAVPTWGAALAAFLLWGGVQVALARAAGRRALSLGQDFSIHLRAQLLDRFPTVSFRHLRALESAEVTRVLSEDAGSAGRAAQSFINLISQVLLCGAYLIASILIAPRAAIGVLVLALPLLLLGRRGPGKNETLAIRDGEEKLAESARDYALNLRGSRIHQATDRATRRVADASLAAAHRYRDYGVRALRRARDQQWMVLGLFGAFVALLEWIGGSGLDRLLPMAVIYLRLSPRVQALQVQRSILSVSTGGLGAIDQLLGALQATPEPRGAAPPGGDIRLHALRFEYEPGASALVLPDATLRKGTWTSVVGPSGVGKSTLLHLLTGLELPTHGTIHIGDVRLGDLDGVAWRHQLAHVEQAPCFVNASLEDNLRAYELASAPISTGDLDQVLATCGLTELVATLPARLATPMDERGSHFSSGQKQRIALARALLRRPKLLLLDEATNALDEASERLVLQAVRTYLPQATIVAASHRSATIAFGDSILDLTPDPAVRSPR